MLDHFTCISNFNSKAFISISGIRIFDEVSKPASRIANIGSLGLVVNKDKLVDKIIDVDRAEAQNVVYFGTNVDEILMKTYSLLKFKNFGGINPDNNTVINKIYSNAIIKNNEMLINELYFETQLIQSTGSGNINLINKRINSMESQLIEISEKLNIKSLNKIKDQQFELANFFWHYQNSENKINIDWKSLSENSKVALLTSTRWQEDLDSNLISKALEDPSQKVQISAIRIIADRNIKVHKKDLELILTKVNGDSQLSKVTTSALKKL